VHGRRHGGAGGARLPAGLPDDGRRDPVGVSPRRVVGRQGAARQAAREPGDVVRDGRRDTGLDQVPADVPPRRGVSPVSTRAGPLPEAKRPERGGSRPGNGRLPSAPPARPPSPVCGRPADRHDRLPRACYQPAGRPSFPPARTGARQVRAGPGLSLPLSHILCPGASCQIHACALTGHLFTPCPEASLRCRPGNRRRN